MSFVGLEMYFLLNLQFCNFQQFHLHQLGHLFCIFQLIKENYFGCCLHLSTLSILFLPLFIFSLLLISPPPPHFLSPIPLVPPFSQHLTHSTSAEPPPHPPFTPCQVDGVSLQGCSEQRAMEVLRRTGPLVRLKLLRRAVHLGRPLPPAPPLPPALPPQPLRHSQSICEGGLYRLSLNQIQETGTVLQAANRREIQQNYQYQQYQC